MSPRVNPRMAPKIRVNQKINPRMNLGINPRLERLHLPGTPRSANVLKALTNSVRDFHALFVLALLILLLRCNT